MVLGLKRGFGEHLKRDDVGVGVGVGGGGMSTVNVAVILRFL